MTNDISCNVIQQAVLSATFSVTALSLRGGWIYSWQWRPLISWTVWKSSVRTLLSQPASWLFYWAKYYRYYKKMMSVQLNY